VDGGDDTHQTPAGILLSNVIKAIKNNKVSGANITHGKGDTCSMHSSFVVNDVLRNSVIITAYARGLMSVTICLDSKTSYHTSVHTV
jgi:hypothetical protein